jgi:hypothetical protein
MVCAFQPGLAPNRQAQELSPTPAISFDRNRNHDYRVPQCASAPADADARAVVADHDSLYLLAAPFYARQ